MLGKEIEQTSIYVDGIPTDEAIEDEGTSVGLPLSELESRAHTERYLQRVLTGIESDIKVREKADNLLLFVGCQALSTSLAWLLFLMQIDLVLINLCALIGLAPGLSHIADDLNLSLSSTGWEVKLGKTPLMGIIKLSIGGASSYAGLSKIHKQIASTKIGIATTHTEIRQLEKGKGYLDYFDINPVILPVLVVVAIVGFMLNKNSRKPVNKENTEE